MKKIFLLTSLVSSSLTFAFSPKLEAGFQVRDPEHKWLSQFSHSTTTVVDHVTRDGYELYGQKSLADLLTKNHLAFSRLGRSKAAGYPTYEEFQKKLQDIHQQYPQLTELVSIGKSVQGRDLWFLKISNQPGVDQHKPEAKYISTMHGDEITGRELTVQWVEELLAGYNSNPEFKALIDATEIYVMPSMNPDGTNLVQRYNANGTDLNRDFPDFTTDDNVNKTDGRAPETQAIMKFQASRNFALSANFHGGSEVVNYPWDTKPEPHPYDTLAKELSLTYASRVDYISQSTEFPQGITNGYAWYEVNGGMQDWSYYWHNDFQLTIELSETKYPNYSDIPKFYQANKAALTAFVEKIHQGMGFYLAAPGLEGDVKVLQKNAAGTYAEISDHSFMHSEFYKVLEPGSYRFEVKLKDGRSATYEDTVVANEIKNHIKELAL